MRNWLIGLAIVLGCLIASWGLLVILARRLPRIKILWALLQGESSVACLADLVGAAPTAVSQHLANTPLTPRPASVPARDRRTRAGPPHPSARPG